MKLKGSCHVGVRKVTRGTYRRSWIRRFGPIPKGHELHHLCENPSCSNLEHLVPLTRAEHMEMDGRIKGEAAKAAKAAQTHCAHGHEFTPENTGTQKRANGATQRFCRICRRAAQQRYAAKAKGGDA